MSLHSVHLKRSSVQKKMQVFTQRSEVLTEEVDRILGLLQSLKNENQELKAQRSKDAASIRDARDRIAVLEQEIDSMKVASALSGDDVRRKEARAEVTGMLREIDKCLALLQD